MAKPEGSTFMYPWLMLIGTIALIVDRYWLHLDALFWTGLAAVAFAGIGAWDNWRTRN